MLTWMRKLSQTWLSSLFMGGLALSFGLWGINDIFRGSVSDSVAEIGSTSISQQAFQEQYRKDLDQFRRQTGQSLTPEQARAQGFGEQALQGMIGRVALDNIAAELGLTETDAAVVQRIQADPSFAGPLGTFDKETFEGRIAQAGYSEQSFIQTMRSDLTRLQLITPLTAGVDVPLPLLRAIFAEGNEVRAAQYVVVTPQAAGQIPPPTDAQLAAYVKAHPDKFSTPEYRDVEYAYIGPEDVASEIHVTDDQIRTAYEQAKDTYVVPEKRDLEQMTFGSLADAAATLAKIKAGQSFDAVGAARGLKPADLSLGTRVAADLDKARAAAAFALPVNGTSDPVKGDFGYVLLHVSAITPGSTKTLADATPELKKQLTDQLAGAKLADVANAYTDALGAASGSSNEVATAAKQAGMQSGHIAAIDRNGLGPDGKPVGPAGDEFRAQVFAADIGEAGDPFESKDGHYFAIKVDGVVPPKLKPLDQVRADATAAWTAEQSAALLRAKAESLATDANRTQNLTAAAAAVHASVQSSPALTRRTADDTFSADLVRAIFTAAPGAAVIGPLGKGDGLVIARVTGIAHPSLPQGFERQGQQIVSQQFADDLVQSFETAARTKEHVTIHRDMADKVTGGGEGS